MTFTTRRLPKVCKMAVLWRSDYLHLNITTRLLNSAKHLGNSLQRISLCRVRNLSEIPQRLQPELQMFTKEQEKLVLDQINEMSLDEFYVTKGIGPARGKALVEYRIKHGSFSNLADLAAVKGFGRMFFQNLLKSDCILPIQKKKHKLSSLLTPEQKKGISSLVSVDIGLSNAAYVHIDRNKLVLDWKRMSVQIPKPYNPGECKIAVQQLVSTLPDAELYIIELQSHRASRTDPAMFPFVLHLRIVEAMLHCLLKDKLVFEMNPTVTARYFGLPVGMRKKRAAVDLISFMIKKSENINLFEESPRAFFEKVSSQNGGKETVQTILAASCMENEWLDPKWQANVPQNLVDYFLEEKKKDDLSDCLLQALSFLNLAFQD